MGMRIKASAHRAVLNSLAGLDSISKLPPPD
jgi:hypothetical protein